MEFFLTIDAPDTEIYYTMDGVSLPDNNTFQYVIRRDGLTNKLQVRETTLVQVIGYHRPTNTYSKVESENFIVRGLYCSTADCVWVHM